MPRLRWRPGLYALTDTEKFSTEELIQACEEVLQGGAVILQYRDKSNDAERRLDEAKQLRALTIKHQATFIINDDVQLCKAVDADGVHLGQNDLDIQKARGIVGLAKIIGVSCYNDYSLAQNALQQGANYVAFGAFFSSPTKPNAVVADLDLLHRGQTLGIPIVAIGGITLENADSLLDAGAHNLAVISNLWESPSPKQQAQSYAKLMQNIELPNFEQGY